ncbi:hypothetical protein CsSME_00050020 [Camellia sinensis var. sinensis]
MPSKRSPNLTIGQIPNLHSSIPRRRHNRRLKIIRAKSNTTDPIGMSITILNRVLTLTQSVPQLDRAVSGSRDDLAIIEGESDGEDIFGVADEVASSDASGEVPEAESGHRLRGRTQRGRGRTEKQRERAPI